MGIFRDLKSMRRMGKEAQAASGRRGGFRGMGDLLSQVNTTMAQAQENAQLLESGTPAEAVVVAARETGMVVNHRHVVEMDLEVQSASGGSYQASVTTSLAMTSAPYAVPGGVVALRVDPADPSRVAIDWDSTIRGPEAS